MDFGRAFGAEFHELSERVHEGKPARVVTAWRVYDTDADDLWDALTNKERIPRWFLPVTGDLELGGRYQLEASVAGSITRCEPPGTLAVTWEYDGQVSWVVVSLAPEAKGTRLTLEHIMLKDEAAEEHWEKYGPSATGVGWDLSFMGLGLHLESGGGFVGQDAVDAWLVTPEGKARVHQWTEDWAVVHVATGEASDVAQAMARRTAGFYTGEATD